VPSFDKNLFFSAADAVRNLYRMSGYGIIKKVSYDILLEKERRTTAFSFTRAVTTQHTAMIHDEPISPNLFSAFIVCDNLYP